MTVRPPVPPTAGRVVAGVNVVTLATAAVLLLVPHASHAGGVVATAAPAGVAAATPTPTPTPSPTATAPPRIVTSWLSARDTTRRTVSHGRVLADSRTLPTMVLRPSTAGPHPLVVFCHGYDISPRPYLHLLTHWAAAGFVVAAPYFPLTRPKAGRWLDEADVDHQPRDVSVVITAVEHRLGAQVDPDRVVVAGHSDGGSTAFATVFAERVSDPRVDAVMVFSGDLRPRLKPYAAPARRLPLLLVQSDRDEFNPVASAAAVWRIATAPKVYLHLHGARHLPPFARDCPWRPVVEAVTTDFLRAWTTRSATRRTAWLHALDRAGNRPGLSRVADVR